MAAPYELWDTRKSLGVFRDSEPPFEYWLKLFGYEINSTDEYIDFEKIPTAGRKLAPFVRPLGSGKPIYQDQSSAFRFKPAYIKVKDAIDPLAPLVKRPGIESMLDPSKLSPMQRRTLIKAAMALQHITAIRRRWEWMAAEAITKATITVEGEEYPAVTLDFKRAGNHTVVKTNGSYWGESGISIFDDIQTYADRMFNAPFGGFPTRMTIGTKVWAAMRQNDEFMKHMDTNLRNPAATVERGVIGADRAIKVGELVVGGASGSRIEIWLYRDTYEAGGMEVPFMANTDVVFTASPDRIQGYQCFGAIIDPKANYAADSIFARSWEEQGDPAVEYLLHQSAPLMVPVNPNATLKATVVAA